MIAIFSHRLLVQCLDELSTTLTFFPFPEANRVEEHLFKRKLAHHNEKGQSIESFYEPLRIGTEDYFSALKQSLLDLGEIMRTQAIVVENKLPSL